MRVHIRNSYIYIERERMKNLFMKLRKTSIAYEEFSNLNYSFELCITYAVGNQVSNRKCLLELIKRRGKVFQSNMSRECRLNFDQ